MTEKQQIKQDLEKKGFFYHKGGDFHDTLGCHFSRGIWADLEKGKKWMGKSWEEAKERADLLGI